MVWEKVCFNRNTLYEQIWSKPILTVAKSYGISNVGLAKICARLNVPRPGRGYWERLRRGRKVTRPPLKPLAAGQEEEYVSERRARPSIEPELKTEFELAILSEKVETNRIAVPSELVEPHPLVAAVDKRLRHGSADTFGIVVGRRTKKRLEIQVSRMQLDRALRVLDTLVKALEGRGYTVSKETDDSCITALVLGENISVWLEELLTTTERKLSASQLREKELKPWMYSRPEFDHNPNGRLALKLGARVHWERVRQTWSDTAEHRVEDLLNSFISGMVRAAERQRAERLEKERQEQEWAEQRRKREEEECRAAEERKRAERLKQQVDNWDLSRRIREYVEDTRACAALNPRDWKFGETPLEEWMNWALAYADKIDPIGKIRKVPEQQITPLAEPTRPDAKEPQQPCPSTTHETDTPSAPTPSR